MGQIPNLSDFTCGRNMSKLEKSCSITNVANEFGNANVVGRRLWKIFCEIGSVTC